MDERTRATNGALADARIQGAEAEERLREYERAIQAARQEIYHHREEARNKAMGERERKIQEARARAESMVSAAKADLEKEATIAKVTLRGAVESLAAEVTNSFFTPHPTESGREDLQA